MHIDPRQVGRPGTDDGIDVRGARRAVPVGVIPAVSPDRLAGVRCGVFGDQAQAVLAPGGGAEVQPDESQSGGGHVHMTVDEGRCHQGPGQVDLGGTGELVAADGVAAEPADHPVAHRHGGGIRVRRTVDMPVEQQRGHS